MMTPASPSPIIRPKGPMMVWARMIAGIREKNGTTIMEMTSGTCFFKNL